MKNSPQCNRREFLKSGLKLLPLAGVMLSLPYKLIGAEESSRVVAAADASVFSGNELIYGRVEALLHKALAGFFDADPLEGLRSIAPPASTVGIKVNCLSGNMMSTHPSLTAALIKMLKKIGIKDKNIIIWDRFQKDLDRGGFSKKSLRNDIIVAGNDVLGMRRRLTVHRSIASYMSTALDRCDVLINMPVLKDHGIVGITLSMKNYFGAIHNPNKYHFSWDPAVADLYSYKPICKRTKLTIVDALLAQYEGGPPYQPQWTWKPGMILVSEDPVALDRIGWKIIEEKRAEKGIPSLKEDNREPTYIRTAARYNLGIADIEKIQYISV